MFVLLLIVVGSVCRALGGFVIVSLARYLTRCCLLSGCWWLVWVACLILLLCRVWMLLYLFDVLGLRVLGLRILLLVVLRYAFCVVVFGRIVLRLRGGLLALLRLAIVVCCWMMLGFGLVGVLLVFVTGGWVYNLVCFWGCIWICFLTDCVGI